MEWLFGDGYDDCDYTEDEENENESHGDGKDAEDNAAKPSVDGKKSSDWGNMFTVESNSWKCFSCMCRNSGDVTKCAACDAIHLGYEDDAEECGKGTIKMPISQRAVSRSVQREVSQRAAVCLLGSAEHLHPARLEGSAFGFGGGGGLG